MIKKILILCIIFTSISCIPRFKNSEKSSMLGASTNIFRMLPGYKNRRIVWLEFKVAEAILQQRREELYYETKELRLKYRKSKDAAPPKK